jgi:hypothetical protein
MRLSLNLDVMIRDGALVLTDTNGKAISFSSEQSVQRKVNMITLGELSNLPKLEIAKAFGYGTRKSYYDARQVVLNGSPVDLIPQRTGPQTPPKRTREIEILVIQMRFGTDRNMYEIAAELTRLGFKVSSRLVGQILADYGLSKKNPFHNLASAKIVDA